MATAGIEVRNNNNILQITDSFRNLRLISKGIIVLPYDQYAAYTSASLTIQQDQFLAFRCITSDKVVGVHRQYPDSGLTRIWFTGNKEAQIEYYVFGYAVTQPGNCFEIYDRLGRLVFSDGSRFMKVITSVSGTNSNFSNGAIITTTPYSSLLTGAVLLGEHCFRRLYPNSGLSYMYIEQLFNFNSGVITSKSIVVAQYGGGPEYHLRVRPNYSFTILDVTGL